MSEDQAELLHVSYQQVNTGVQEDVRVWLLDNTGKFTIKFYYEAIRPKSKKCSIFWKIWTNPNPTRISLFMWRAMHNILPTETTIRIPIASRYLCCYHNWSREDSGHLLLYSQMARYV